MKGIIAKNLVFAYPNDFVAVDDVSLEIKAGENIAIIGQNGAGKTTFVKMLNGLLRPKSGSITVDGENISEMTVAQISKKVGYVFQNPGDQIFNPTVYEEISYTPRYFKMSDEEVDRRTKDAAELCNISEHLNANPYDLPFSIRKFVTIASVIAMGVDYIVLDEPTAGQDLFGLNQQRVIIEELINRGKTVITITHDMDFVIDNFQRVVVMANKKIVADANKKDIFWDFDVLERSSINQPYISMLAKKLGIGDKVITIPEFIKGVTK